MTTPDNTLTTFTGFILEEQTELTLADVSSACAAQADMIIELVNEGILAPAGASHDHSPDRWRFTGANMYRARIALRLQNDLGVDLAGAALALELLDELQSLRVRLRILEGQ